MGARGPAPKPTKLKILEGNPGHEKLNTQEPRPSPIAPDCPSWLDAEAKREWKRVSPELERLGLLTGIDMAAMAGYCASYSLYVKCKRVLHTKGLTFKTATGYLMPRPEVAIGNRALIELRAFCVQFGLTPSARARMQLYGGPGEDDGDDDTWDI